MVIALKCIAMQKEKHIIKAAESHQEDFGTLLPSQYSQGTEINTYTEGERSLMAAVLIDALRIYEKYTRRQKTRLKRFREVNEWFSEGESDWPFSFLNICKVLGLDPDTVHDTLKKMSAVNAEALFWRKRVRISGQKKAIKGTTREITLL